MSVVINTNYAATVASNNLATSNAQLQRSLNRLSSGTKIVNPSDDAGGLAVSMKLSAAARKECRGAHTVNDYERPTDDPVAPMGRDDANWMKHTLWYSQDNRLSYKSVNLKPLTVDSVPPKVRTF